MPAEELKMFTLFEMTPDLVCIVNKEGYFQKINPAVSKKLGYTEQELKGRPVSSFIHPADRELTARQRKKLLNNTPLLNFQNRYQTKEGATLWLEWTSIYLPDKEIVFAIAKDITVHKEKEAELVENYARFRQLATHFKNNIEKDRKQIAAELHEDLAQLATVVNMEVEWLSSESNNLPSQMESRVQGLVKASKLLINNIRKISYAISPGHIADLGLDAALEMVCEEFAALTGVRCKYRSSFSEEAVSYEVALDVYRICQEALLNIMQHAQATQVVISVLHNADNDLRLTVSDNGKGFDHHASYTGTGLKTMQGRALSINGKLTIASGNNGTSLELLIKSQQGHPDVASKTEHATINDKEVAELFRAHQYNS